MNVRVEVIGRSSWDRNPTKLLTPALYWSPQVAFYSFQITVVAIEFAEKVKGGEMAATTFRLYGCTVRMYIQYISTVWLHSADVYPMLEDSIRADNINLIILLWVESIYYTYFDHDYL